MRRFHLPGRWAVNLTGFLVGLALLGSWGLRAPVAEASLMVEPARIHLYSNAGEPAVAQIRIVNGSSQPQRVYFHFTDWEPAEEGRRLAPGTHPRSLVPFLAPSAPWSWVMEPGEARTLQLRIQRPAHDRGTRWSALALAAEPDSGLQNPQPAPGAETVVAPRLRRQRVIPIHHTPLPLPERGGHISGIQALDARGRWLAVTFANTGLGVLEVTGEWRITDPAGAQRFRQPIAAFWSYPERTQTIRLGPLPQLPPGTYHLLVLLFPDHGPPSAGQIPLVVPSVEGGVPATRP